MLRPIRLSHRVRIDDYQRDDGELGGANRNSPLVFEGA